MFMVVTIVGEAVDVGASEAVTKVVGELEGAMVSFTKLKVGAFELNGEVVGEIEFLLSVGMDDGRLLLLVAG